MLAYYIETLEDAENLTKICDKYPFDVDVIHSTQTLNGKSLLGVSSLMGNIVSVVPVNVDDAESLRDFENEIKAYSSCY